MRHLRSYLLESVDAQVPRLMGDFLDDVRTPGQLKLELLEELFREIQLHQGNLVEQLAAVFAQDREAGRTIRYGDEECRRLVDSFQQDILQVLDGWWSRVQQLNREFCQYSTVGSPVHDMKKAQARQRAYREITQDPERAYSLNYLSTQGLLPAYQFPVDTFSLDPCVVDTPTLYRPAAIAIEEFAPGNYVYANGHKLRSIRVLFAGGPGSSASGGGRSDAETSGRLRSFQLCRHCDEVVESVKNNCPRCGSVLSEAVEAVFVDAFEAEESLRIGSDEESRQRQYHVRRESLISREDALCRLYPYPFTPVEYRRLAEVLITNWGRADSKTGDGRRFWLCPECGRHLDRDQWNPQHQKAIDKWHEDHARLCTGEPVHLVLAYQFQSDCIILNVPSHQDTRTIGRTTLSPTMVTLAEALLAGAGDLLELEPYELAAFPRRSPEGDDAEEIVFYETVPGGAGYVEEIARRLPEVAAAAHDRLYAHMKAVESTGGSGLAHLREQLARRREELQIGGRAPGDRGPESPIERYLLEALHTIPGLPSPVEQYEYRKDGILLTVPDFAYPDARIAIFCDGFAFHGNPDTLEFDAKKRNLMQSDGWIVLTYWGNSIMRDAVACAKEISMVYNDCVNRG